MVDYWDLSTFCASERERKKQVAEMYISSYDLNPEKTSLFFIDQSIHLAASLQGVVLLQLAHALANDDAKMSKRVSTTPEWLRETATIAVAGYTKRATIYAV